MGTVTPVPGKLFIVGDPKQSIYRFRRADVDTYMRVCEQLIAGRRDAAGASPELSQRARTSSASVNAAFAPVMDGDRAALQARYVPLEAVRAATCRASRRSWRCRCRSRTRSASSRRGRSNSRCRTPSAPTWIGWCSRSGWKVTERRNADTRVPIEARHICILFRRFVSYGEDVTPPYVDALEARGIRHLLVGGRAFHNREEIETLRAALMAIEWPDDQLSVFATLRGGALRDRRRGAARVPPVGRAVSSVPRPRDAAAASRIPSATRWPLLASLHRQRNRRPVADTISTLLGETRAHVGFVLRPGGEQALANVLHVAELARQYQMDGGMSFRGFVETLQAEASARQAAEAPILEEGSDGVRLMTVHKAKGLEFPVVILADITARLTPYEAGRHIDTRRQLCALRIGGWSPQGAATTARRRARPRAGGRRARRLRRGDACARSARRAGRRRRTVHRGMDRAAQRGDLSARGRAACPDAPRRLPCVQEQGHRAEPAGRRPGVDAHGVPGRASASDRVDADFVGRVVGAGRAGARRAGVVRSAARRSDRQGRAAGRPASAA